MPPTENSRPDFGMPINPGHLVAVDAKLNPNVPVSSKTPSTFFIQAENDNVDGLKQSPDSYIALANAHVPVEMQTLANLARAFGLRRAKLPITWWTRLAKTWLRSIGIVRDSATASFPSATYVLIAIVKIEFNSMPRSTPAYRFCPSRFSRKNSDFMRLAGLSGPSNQGDFANQLILFELTGHC